MIGTGLRLVAVFQSCIYRELCQSLYCISVKAGVEP